MTRWPVWVGLIFAVAFAGTWLARRYALSRRLIDQPGERRSHVIATPRGGGIAIVVAMLLALALPVGDGMSPLLSLAIGVGLLLVAAVGWIDDHRPLSPWVRLGAHVVAAACLGGGLLATGAAPVVAVASALLALVLTNVWNFMDGIDGLAASQALLVSLGCIVLAGQTAWLPMALVAACLGFLPFNLPPARIFLGDVGSGALGYLLAVFVALQATSAPEYALLLLLPLSAFLVDASLTLARRMLRRERWWLPHTQHAYQRLVRHGRRHATVTFAYAIWTAVMLLNVRCTSGSSAFVKLCALSGSYLAGAITWMWLQRTPHPPETGNDSLEG